MPVMVSGEPMGATGIRIAEASSMISAVVRWLVHSRTAAVNSSRAALPPGEGREVGVAQPLGTLDHHQEVLELLAGDGAVTDVAVGRRLDRRQLQRPAGTGAHDLRGHDAEAAHRDDHGFQHRDVDELADAVLARPPGVRGAGDRRVSPADPLPQPPARRQRDPVGQPASGGRTAARLQGEFGGGLTGTGPRQPERRDRNDDARLTCCREACRPPHAKPPRRR